MTSITSHHHTEARADNTWGGGGGGGGGWLVAKRPRNECLRGGSAGTVAGAATLR